MSAEVCTSFSRQGTKGKTETSNEVSYDTERKRPERRTSEHISKKMMVLSMTVLKCTICCGMVSGAQQTDQTLQTE